MSVSGSQFTGILEITYDLDRRARMMPEETRAFIKDVVNDVHAQYVVNLSGSQPSTTARPLPVGVVSGELKAGATKKMLDDHTGEVRDDVDHAGYIEFGTVNMTPRQPLADAIQQEAKIDTRMDKVMTKVWGGKE